MKKVILTILFIGYLLSFVKGQIPNAKGENSLIGTINKEIESKKINTNAILFLNDEKISLDDLILLNEFPLKDFTSIRFLSASESIEKYGESGKDGAVLMTPFIDNLLTIKYYEGLKNEAILKLVDAYVQKKLIKRNPIFVLDGIPLRGEEIIETINSLNMEKVKDISPVKKEMAYKIYGIRSLPGVLLINTKSANEIENKELSSQDSDDDENRAKRSQKNDTLLSPHPNLLAFECKDHSPKSMDLKKEKYLEIKEVSKKITENTLNLNFKFCSSLYMSEKNRGNIVVDKSKNKIIIFFHLTGEPVKELVEYEMNYKIKLDNMKDPALEFIGKLYNITRNFTKEKRVHYKK